MATYVYRREASNGARDLAEALDACRYRGTRTPIERRVARGDAVICWGEAFPTPPAGVRVLNGAPIQNKFRDAQVLQQAGVPTIATSATQPTNTTGVDGTPPPIWAEVQEAAGELGDLTFARTRPLKDGVRALITKLGALSTELDRVMAPSATWLGRTFNHVGGADLLSPPVVANYWSRKETLVKEFRIHSFMGKSIRAGVKAIREGYREAGTTQAGGTPAHPWVRSWDGGWRILYDGVSSKKKHRNLAHQAVAALGLQFGAVDIGEKADGSLIVLEVNRAPGVENGSVDVYAAAIERWLEEGV